MRDDMCRTLTRSMRATLEIEVDVTFVYEPGGPDVNMRGDGAAQPGAAPAVRKVLRVVHAPTKTDLLECLDQDVRRHLAEEIEGLVESGEWTEETEE